MRGSVIYPFGRTFEIVYFLAFLAYDAIRCENNPCFDFQTLFMYFFMYKPTMNDRNRTISFCCKKRHLANAHLINLPLRKGKVY